MQRNCCKRDETPKIGVNGVLLLIGMGIMIPCYLFTVGNVLVSPWPLYERNRVVLCVLTAVCLAGLYVSMRAIGRHEAFFARHERAILAGAVLFYFLAQMIMAYVLRFTPKTDAEQCFTAAELLVDTGTYGNVERPRIYFSRVPYNLGPVYILAAIFRFFGVFGWSDRFIQVILVFSLLFSVGLFCGARLMKRLGGVAGEMRFLLLMAACLPMLYCTTELYTDAFALPFGTIILYCAMRIVDTRPGETRGMGKLSLPLWIALFVLASWFGAQLRFPSLIASIAAIIFMVLGKKPLRGVVTSAVLVAALAVSSALVDAENARHIDPEYMEEMTLSPLHNIAMGLPIHEDHGYGQYGDGGWYMFSTSFETLEERNAALLEEIVDRLYYLRYPNRLLNMMSRKNLSTFGDGTFWLNEIIESDAHEPDNLVKQVIFFEGAAYPAYYHLCTAMFIAQMILACGACVQAIARRDTRGAPVFIALVGAFILLSAWETRARYFFQFEMLLLCAAAMIRTQKTNMKRAEV